ncbi:DAK2 domain-containing protein [Levilactobacillus brevis]|uniref:DAK2 domain-containing protein n=1 Tax=Levilactobacillus brevis TaxID=1580 RepID=UPI0020747E44|nr:DAK2 domain-containing protein [Levilactobacillus brevis]MCM6799129.1 DAK2 domain-containing protein [Levilactobacillus brevis]MCM6802176.1 DAK2 domain-containing protein [Levilactobacillus brevis]MCM6805404.1 DAK2 domain-containing protein [Levilactobacillus brevis]MCM6807171.1 DAK2 domain-containing protein [Levilactobacillus brevis]MCM6813052.1 DAK2 domain-containing protein [Levilactobacillus brevis]
MKVTEITNLEFGKMVQAASQKLNQNADFINSLNVFPVPDGDTGTNMSLSLASGAKYERDADGTAVGVLATALAKGLLMGARGNSGVILSQIFRGFSKKLADKQTLTAQDLADGFAAGAETAYKAVMKPTEGTILTVVREGAQAGLNTAKSSDDVLAVMDAIYEAAKAALATTPDLLPVLKQVGVVDSGGQGLTFVLEAFNDSLNGRVAEDGEYKPDDAEMDEMIDAAHHQSVQGKLDPNSIKYGYCTEIMVRIGRGKQVDHDFDYDEFYKYLADLGDSLLVVNDDEIVKVHVHTEHPGKVIAWGQEFGDLAKVKVDNMRMQQEAIMEHDEEAAADAGVVTATADEAPADTAIIAIAAGDGLATLFKSLGVTHVVNGGQTMNPSTQDIVDAINQSQAKRAIVLPNNKNIFLAAEQAAKVADIPSVIVHSKTVSQGMTAMLGYNPDAELEDNQASMEENLSAVKSGQVTHAIRDTQLDGFDIKEGNFMGIVDGTIKVTDADLLQTAVATVKAMLDDDSEIITIIYGADTTADVAEQLQQAVEALDDDLETEVHEGDQPVYPFLISVE